MKRRRNYSSYFALAALLLASLACQAVQGSDPTSVPEDPSSSGQNNPFGVPTLEPAITSEPPVQTGGTYDGSWTGTNTVDGKDILFEVENNEVVSFSLNYTGEASGCTYHGAVSAGSRTSSSVDSAVIDNDEFSLSYTNINDELIFNGAFTSDSEASGTLLIKSSADGLCGAYEKEVTWTASKGSSAEVDPATTEEPSTLFPDADAIAIVTGFFDAVNAGNVDTAIGMVDEGIMFSIGSDTLFDQNELKSYLQSHKGVTFQISDAQSLGGAIVQFKAKTSDGGNYSTCQAFLLDGKISMVTMTP